MRYIKYFLCLSIFFFSTSYAIIPKLLIKIPTRQRPKQFFKYLSEYYRQLSQKFPYHFLISCDTDDILMNNDSIKEIFAQLPNLTVKYGSSTNKIEAYNADLSEFMQKYDILILASDDFWPVSKNFDEIIVHTMLKYFPDFDGVLHFNDQNQGNELLNTYPIIGKKFFHRFGYAYYPGYKSFYCDTELTLISKVLKKEIYIPVVLFRHDFGKQWDALYERNNHAWENDYKLFLSRKAHNFNLGKKS